MYDRTQHRSLRLYRWVSKDGVFYMIVNYVAILKRCTDLLLNEIQRWGSGAGHFTSDPWNPRGTGRTRRTGSGHSAGHQ